MIGTLTLLLSSVTLHDTDVLYDPVLVPRTETALYASVRASTSSADDAPIGGAKVIVSLAGREVGRAFTDAGGRAVVRFVVPELEVGRHTLEIATSSEIGADTIARSVAIEEHLLLSIRTDRTVYRPGETIHYAIALQNRADAHPIGGPEIEVSVKDPRGTQIWRGRLATDATGFAAGRMPLGDDLRLGTHRIEAAVRGARATAEVSVREVDLPPFFVTIEPATSPPVKGGTVIARYPYGEPVRGRVSVTGGASIEGELDAFGRFTFAIARPGETVHARVTDGARRTESASLDVPAVSRRTSIAIVPEHGPLSIGRAHDVLVVTTDGNALARRRITFAAEGADLIGPSDLVSPGAVRVRVTPRRSTFRITASAGEAEAVADLEAVRSAPHVRTAEAVVDPHTPIQVEGRFRSAGPIAVALIRERTPVALVIANADRFGRFAATIVPPPGVFGLSTVRATEIREDARSVTAPVYLAPAALRVLISGQTRFRPGERGELTAVVTDDRGTPAEGVGLFASVVDERALAVGRPQKNLAELLQSLDVDRAELLGIAFTELLGTTGSASAIQPGGRTSPHDALAIEAPSQRTGRFEQDPAVNGIARRAVVEALPMDDRAPLFHFDAAVRREAETRRIDAFYDQVIGALVPKPGPIGRRTAGRWRFEPALADVLTEAGLDAKDPWGRLLDWDYAERHVPRFAFHAVAAAVAERRLERIATAVAEKRVRPANVGLAGLLAAAGLDPADALDPWGRRLSIGRDAGGTTIRSAGPDGRHHTSDDLFFTDVFAEHGATGIGGLGTRGYGMGGGGAGFGLRGVGGRSVSIAAPAIRARFDETVLWAAGIRTDRNGEATLAVPFSDSVTGWRLAVDALGPSGSVGHGEKKLETFLPLSVDADVPRALTTGDRYTLSAVAANHGDADALLEIAVSAKGAIRVIGEPVHRLSLPKGTTGAAPIAIVADTGGDATVRLELRSEGTPVDTVERSVRVDGPGRVIEVAVADTVGANGTLAFRMTERPALASFEGVLRLFRGPLDQALDGIEDLLQEPHGCFEQTSSATHPNLMVLDLLDRRPTRTAGHDEVRRKAADFVARGYQRLIGYEVDGGGFSWFGDAPANQALTAYGLLEFTDMAKVYPVDPELIARTRRWLLSKQASDGAWRPDERWLHDWSAVEGELSMTAYIAWALAETGEPDPKIDAAFAYLERRRDELERRPFLLALWAAGESRRSSAKAEEILALLERHRLDAGGLAFGAGGETLFYASGRAADVQVTALAATALLRAGRTSEAREAFRWIWSARTPRYGWGTPQGTVLSLRAAAAIHQAPPPGGTVAVTLDGAALGHLDLESAGVPSIRLPALPLGDHRLAIGSGAPVLADLRLSWRSDRDPEPLDRGLRVDLEAPKEVRFGERAAVRVAITNTTGERIAMPTAVIPTPPGFAADRRSLRALETAGIVDRFEIDGDVRLYMTEAAPRSTIRLTYELVAEAECDVTMRGARAFAYYDPDTMGESPNLRLVSRR